MSTEDRMSGAYAETGRWEPRGFCQTCGYPRTVAGACVDQPTHLAGGDPHA